MLISPWVGVHALQIVKPYQLWTSTHVTLFHISYYCLTAAWCFLLGVHLEEFLFWNWLLQVIRTQQSKSWFKSVYFKLWCLGCIGGVGLLFGAATMELDSLTRVSRDFPMSAFATLKSRM